MGVFGGVEKNWAALTDVGRTHVATKGVVQSGLVLNLDSGASRSYGGSGTTWTDLSGLGNTGTLVNGPTYSSSNGGSLSFNGTNQYVNLGSKFRYQDNFTVECVAKINSASPVLTAPCGSQNPIFVNNAYGWNLMFSGTTGKPYWNIYNTFTTSKGVGSTIGNLGDWVHCVAYKSGTTIELYVNGISQGTNTLTTNAVYYISLDCTIGGYYSCSTVFYYLNGSVPLSRIYNRALSAAEIQQNFNAMRGRYSL